MTDDAPDPVPAPLDAALCLRMLVHAWDDDDAARFIDALREARRVIAALDALDTLDESDPS
jgi:hypothetical protein